MPSGPSYILLYLFYWARGNGTLGRDIKRQMIVCLLLIKLDDKFFNFFKIISLNNLNIKYFLI